MKYPHVPALHALTDAQKAPHVRAIDPFETERHFVPGGGMMATGRNLLPMGRRVGMGVQFPVQVVHLLLVCFLGTFANAATGQCEPTLPSA